MTGTIGGAGQNAGHPQRHGDSGSRILSWALLSVLAGIFIVEVLLCLTPPVSRDALIHHLAIPKLWIRHGAFFETPWAPFSYFPMNVDVLYLVPLLFGNDTVPALIHLAFGWATGYLVYRYLREQAGRAWGLFGLLLFASTPMVVRLSVTAYVDLGMIFFTTAGVLAFLKWRDGRCEVTAWLVVSAACMGAAAGTKYNAFIAWAFVNGAVCFLCAKETKEPGRAIRRAALFFLVALAVASPWLVKNLVLKGNPVYPLMDGLFAFIHGGREPAAFFTAGEAPGRGFSLVAYRTQMYGEGIGQILLLPLRIFFEGRDNSPQHFDGVLNPFFALALPFAFIGNRGGHRGFLLAFVLFVFGVSALAAEIRIRYVLPILPFVAILAVLGLRNGLEWLRGRRGALPGAAAGAVLAATALFIGMNLSYLAGQYTASRPLDYLAGQETREEYLLRRVGSYPAVSFINRSLPDDAVVYLLYLGGRGYYLDREYIHHVGQETSLIKAMVRSASDTVSLTGFLRSLGVTHLLVREDLLWKALEDNFPEATVRGFLETLAQCVNPVYETNGHAVYRIR